MDDGISTWLSITVGEKNGMAEKILKFKMENIKWYQNWNKSPIILPMSSPDTYLCIDYGD